MKSAKRTAPASLPAPPPSPVASKRGGWLSTAVAAAALVWIGWVGLNLTHTTTVTTDEPGHLGAGLSYWKNRDYALTTVNLFFTQKWAAWPLIDSNVPFPDAGEQARLKKHPKYIGELFLASSSADPRILLAPARQMTLILWLLTGVMVCAWTWRLGGPWAGALATVLYATCPVILSTAVLVTTDTGTAFWYFALLWSYTWLLNRPHAGSALLTGICAGMLALSKFSVAAWLLGALLLLGWHLWRQRGRYSLPALAGWHAAAIVAAWGTVWTFFGWTFQPGNISYVAAIEPRNGWEQILRFFHAWHLFPEPFLRELLMVRDMVQERNGYLFGKYQMGGHLLYFPVAFVVKSTIASLLALGAWLLVRPAGKSAESTLPPSLAPIVCSALGYTVLAVFTPINIGVRHILPLFILAAVVGGVALARFGQSGRIRAGLVAAIVLLAGGEAFSARHQPMAWFNLASGGPMNGYRIMVESSLEWGGDLGGVVAWQKKRPAQDQDVPVYIHYLGPPGLSCYGLKAMELSEAFWGGKIRPGYFIFSATRLMGGPDIMYGQMTEEHIDSWNRAAPYWQKPLRMPWNDLAVARLAEYCRSRTPTERIGPVYFVFRLDEKDLQTALAPTRAPR